MPSLFSAQDTIGIIWDSINLVAITLLYFRSFSGDTFLLTETTVVLSLGVANYVTKDVSFSFALASAALRISLHLILAVLLKTAYRLSPFHPLASFPGPMMNKITRIKWALVVASGRRHLVAESLHRKYGKFVRTGPNTLSINSHNAVRPIYADATCMDKSNAYYLGRHKGDGLFFIREKERHNKRRRLWAGAFTSDALKEYHSTLERRTIELLDCMENRKDENGAVNMTEAIQHWSYDVMGSLTFGNSNRLEMMTHGDPQQFVGKGQLATMFFEIIGEMPPLVDLLSVFNAATDLQSLERIATQLMQQRKEDASAPPTDIASYLLGEHKTEPLTEQDLNLDTLFAIQAGSDSTSSVLTIVLYHLISNPSIYKRLQAELDQAFPGEDPALDFDLLAKLPYLEGVVKEGLRLGTPFPALPRVVPRGGITIEERFIPEGTIVGVPAYSQDISEENFWPEPMAFLPERWLPDGLGPETKTRQAAIMSFSSGTFGCLGRHLAAQELRTVTARLVLTCNLQFAPTFDRDAFVNGITNIRTTFFSHPLKVVASYRNPNKQGVQVA